jgi:hypothetical protein
VILSKIVAREANDNAVKEPSLLIFTPSPQGILPTQPAPEYPCMAPALPELKGSFDFVAASRARNNHCAQEDRAWKCEAQVLGEKISIYTL